ncbi:MAG: phosphoribosylanthranilate isomerase, partial [Thermomicrobiaceae bacterium]|nr:phosphoribosylanthranilate isomerase [Thermomicrobiaceae bacterium]
LRAVVETLGLDLVQLSGDEPPDDLAALGRPAIKALRLGPDAGWDEARRLAERYLAGPAPAWALLVDAHVPGAYGGTGRRANWDLAARLAEEYPVILAGGLTPECVADAIEATRPLGVDVSSGVETDGVKDHEKIRAFVAAARAGRLVGATSRARADVLVCGPKGIRESR